MIPIGQYDSPVVRPPDKRRESSCHARLKRSCRAALSAAKSSPA